MAALTLTIPKEAGYVAAVALSTVFLTTWQTFNVSKHRKAAGIPYPFIYATKEQAAASPAANRFNCAQRAHQNTLEVLPSLFVTLLISALKYPQAAAGLGAIVVAGRAVYTIGYSSGDPKKRTRGAFEYIGRIGLLVASVRVVYDMIIGQY